MIYLAILSQIIWWQAKSSNGREWPNKFEQFMFYITNRWRQ